MQKPASSGGYRSSAAGSGAGGDLLPPHSFLDPFSSELWASLAAAYVLTSLTLFFVARVSPYERRATMRDANSCFGGGDGFSLCNAFWYTFAGFCMRGSNIAANVSDQINELLKSTREGYFGYAAEIVHEGSSKQFSALLSSALVECILRNSPFRSEWVVRPAAGR